MEANTLLAHLRSAGLTVRCNGDQLIVAPRDRLTDELRAAIRERKPELLKALTAERPYDPKPPTADLLERIRRMAKRWGFSPDELTEELNRAAADPTKALLWVEHDEWKFGAGDTLYVQH